MRRSTCIALYSLTFLVGLFGLYGSYALGRYEAFIPPPQRAVLCSIDSNVLTLLQQINTNLLHLIVIQQQERGLQ